MIEIDGSEGEGGGQMVRTSLALSAITGKPFRIFNVRAGRKKPGLKRQHVTCALAMGKICNAKVEGAYLQSDEMYFIPGKVETGRFDFSLGTAGSTTLVAQTILPALMIQDAPSTITIEGGTHNPMAPSFEFLDFAYLATVEKMGPQFEARLDSFGFYPAGGGRIQVSVEPADELKGIDLTQSRGRVSVSAIAIVSGLPEHIGQREIQALTRKLDLKLKSKRVVAATDPKGPGNALVAILESESVTEVLFEFGARGVRAEQVASRLGRRVASFLAEQVPVGEHLADQLMLPMALAASRNQTSSYRTVSLSQHSRTQREVIVRFLDDIQIQFVETDLETTVNIGPADVPTKVEPVGRMH